MQEVFIDVGVAIVGVVIGVGATIVDGSVTRGRLDAIIRKRSNTASEPTVD